MIGQKILLILLVSLAGLIGIALLLTFVISGTGFTPLGSVAVIPVKGDITDDKPYFDATLTASEVVEKLDEAQNDATVSAILLDIDSPGGGIVATKNIAYKVREIEKPVVAFIGESGASGGYYVAASADYIFADADSITGSIGVVSIVVNLKELLEKYGVKVTVLTEGKFKGMGNMFEGMNEEEQAILQGILSSAYHRFKSDILSFREGKLTAAQLEAVADGRILSGEQAFNSNLIDALGTKQDAINKAAELAGIGVPPAVRTYSKETPTLLDLLTASGYYFGIGLRQGMAQAAAETPQIRA